MSCLSFLLFLVALGFIVFPFFIHYGWLSRNIYNYEVSFILRSIREHIRQCLKHVYHSSDIKPDLIDQIKQAVRFFTLILTPVVGWFQSVLQCIYNKDISLKFSFKSDDGKYQANFLKIRKDIISRILDAILILFLIVGISYTVIISVTGIFKGVLATASYFPLGTVIWLMSLAFLFVGSYFLLYQNGHRLSYRFFDSIFSALILLPVLGFFISLPTFFPPIDYVVHTLQILFEVALMINLTLPLTLMLYNRPCGFVSIYDNCRETISLVKDDK